MMNNLAWSNRTLPNFTIRNKGFTFIVQQRILEWQALFHLILKLASVEDIEDAILLFIFQQSSHSIYHASPVRQGFCIFCSRGTQAEVMTILLIFVNTVITPRNGQIKCSFLWLCVKMQFCRILVLGSLKTKMLSALPLSDCETPKWFLRKLSCIGFGNC